MLVLSRKPAETIYIGKDIEITIVRISPNKVRLGIKAPRDVNIVREEIAGTLPAGPVGDQFPEPADAA